jgi:hypothetical protein
LEYKQWESGNGQIKLAGAEGGIKKMRQTRKFSHSEMNLLETTRMIFSTNFLFSIRDRPVL